ncbi:hypothetical protein MJ588_06035 [Klebsiella pneumoniae]|nr:hypothetical protein MJ588_06035 [Klebsiella pneumoniae]
MLSIAGVIGASLFVGSSVAIAEAGPAVLLAYLFAGLLVVMIMRMLAEMAVATPDTGFPFPTYADKAIGRWAGYTIGCSYTGGSGSWLFRWKPISRRLFCIRGCRASRVWLFSLVITHALTGGNLLSVKNYGEFEFWLALCTVIAILAFIVLGAVAHYRLLSLCRSRRHFAAVGPRRLYAEWLRRGAERDADHHVLVYGRGDRHHRRRRIGYPG